MFLAVDTSSTSKARCGCTSAVDPALQESRRGRPLNFSFPRFDEEDRAAPLCLDNMRRLITFATNAKCDRYN